MSLREATTGRDAFHRVSGIVSDINWDAVERILTNCSPSSSLPPIFLPLVRSAYYPRPSVAFTMVFGFNLINPFNQFNLVCLSHKKSPRLFPGACGCTRNDRKVKPSPKRREVDILSGD